MPRGSGPKPSVGKLLGKSRGGATNIKGAPGAKTSGTTDPSQSGASDVVQQRTAQATQGVMYKKEMAKSKSTGIKVGRAGGRKR